MKNKVTAIVLISVSIMATILSAILNFNKFLMGDNATTKNIVVTTVYISVWILVTIIGIIIKQRNIIKYCSVFWGITMFLNLLGLLTTIVDISADIVDLFIPLMLLLQGPLFGVQPLAKVFHNGAIVMSLLIPSLMFAVTFVSLKRLKQVLV